MAECPRLDAVYAMDLLGFGSSQKPEGVTYDPHLWKDQVVNFVNTLVPEPCVLLGNSIGSQVGQSLLQQREKCSSRCTGHWHHCKRWHKRGCLGSRP